MSIRGARRRQPSQSSLRYQQKKALNVLIRPVYRHDRIGECGTSDVAMIGIRTSAPLFARDAKIRQNPDRFSRGLRNRFYIIELGLLHDSTKYPPIDLPPQMQHPRGLCASSWGSYPAYRHENIGRRTLSLLAPRPNDNVICWICWG